MIEDAFRIVAAGLLGSGMGLVGLAVAVRVGGRSPSIRRWTAWLAAPPVAMTLAFHALAPFGAFRLVPVLAFVSALSAFSIRLLGGPGAVTSLLRDELRFLRRLARRAASSPFRGVTTAFFVCASPVLLRAVVAPPLGWDTFTYHALKAGMWVQGGGIDAMEGTGAWGYYRDMLGGGDVLFAWALLPIHGDALTGAFGVLQWFALGVCLVGLGRELGGREPWPTTTAGFLMALPAVRLLVGTAYVEVGLLLSFTAGLALGLRSLRRGSRAALLLAAASLGVAAAHKLPMVLVGGVALAVVLALSPRRAGKVALSFAAALLFCLPSAGFLARSWSRNGAPLSPLPVRLFGFVAGEASPEVRWYMDRPGLADAAYRPGPELEALSRVFAAPGEPNGGLGPFAWVAILAGLALVWRLRPRAAALCVAVAAANLAAYYAPGFSLVRLSWSVSSGRFLLPAVAVLATAGACALAPSRRAGWYRGLLLAGTFFALLQTSRHGIGAGSTEAILWLLAVAGTMATFGAAALATLRPPFRAPAAAASLLAALLGLVALRDAYRSRILSEDFGLHSTPAYWSEAASLVDEPRTPRVIAVTSGPDQDLDNWFASPFLGRRLQNRLVNLPVAADGHRRRWGVGDANAELRRTADYPAWRRAIDASGVTDVMSFSPPSTELAFMEAHRGEFERRAGVPGEWGLFRVRRQR